MVKEMFVRLAIIGLGFFLTIMVVRHALAQDIIQGPIEAEIIKVIDGDTLEVKVKIWLGQEILTRVRIAGIDTPEKSSACPMEKNLADQATHVLEDFLVNQKIYLSNIRYGKYAGRVLADISDSQGRDAANHLITSQLARPYDGGKRLPWCA